MNHAARAEPPAPPQGPRLALTAGPAPDPIGAWLDVLVSLIDLPAADRASIRDELDEHLRERVRDLILSGTPEPAATTAAIAELGDAAALARRFRTAAHAPRRRFVMNTALFSLAGAALITSLVALQGEKHASPATVFQPPAAAATAAGDPRVSCTENMMWAEFFANAGAAAKLPVFVYWNRLADQHTAAGTPIEAGVPMVGVSFRDLPLSRAIAFLNQSMGAAPDEGLAVREQDGILMFSTVQHLDRLDQALATFDLSGLVAARRQSLDDPSYPADKVMEEACRVITTVVHEDLWNENGGDRARISVFDSRLFVSAPRRIVPQIEWVIGELTKGAPVAEGAVPVGTYVFSLGHVYAIDAQRAILDRHPRAAGRARFVADPSSNSLIVTCTRKEHEAIADILSQLDHAADPTAAVEKPGAPAEAGSLLEVVPRLTR